MRVGKLPGVGIDVAKQVGFVEGRRGADGNQRGILAAGKQVNDGIPEMASASQGNGTCK